MRSRSLTMLLGMVVLVAAAAALALDARADDGARPGNWADWRGPTRDGVSLETGLPDRWSPAGENLSWKAPFGGRSAPIVMDNRLYVQNAAGEGATRQERVMCFNADTGKLLWEYRFNVYMSDVPPHRVGWASPVGDPESGNVYAYGVGGDLVALTSAGKVLWQRSLGEEFGLVTTHGGRTVSPVIEGDLVIVSGISSGWGAHARAAHRFFAFDKKTGETVWVNSPGGRPYDTTYAAPVAAVINGTRLLIAGGGDGTIHAMKPQTGEPVWSYEISKRGINTGVVLKGATAFVTHGEENIGTNEMGLLAAVDASATGKMGPQHVKWRVEGVVLGSYSSPVIDGDRIYQVDNGGNLFAFDVATGKHLWTLNLGTIQKASPVVADGKLYVGTENGKFFILKPGPDRGEILDEDQLGTEQAPEAIIASAAVSQGRIYLVTADALYCIGKKKAPSLRAAPAEGAAAPPGEPAYVQVAPTELTLGPGDRVQLRARLFDARGRFLRDAQASWALDQLEGTVENGLFVAATAPRPQAGEVKASVGSITGAARVRVLPPLPWTFDFDALPGEAPPRHWINASGKFALRVVDGNKQLVKLADNPFTKRARVFMGPSDWSDYTVEVDVMATERRRQMGDGGIVAQRYALVLFGSSQRLEIQSWQPETTRTVTQRFAWKPSTWYRLKLRVENQPGGTVRARGKAWPAAEPEPAEWTVEKIDKLGNRGGSPGLYGDAPFEVFFDNFKVYKN